MRIFQASTIAPTIVVILHLVGIIGISAPLTSDYFLALTPLNLFISAFLLIITHPDRNRSFYIALSICYFVGFFVEVIGVQTGFPFGQYSYGHTLGPKLWGTPLIIGVNWFMLSYAFYQITRFISSKWLRPVVGATLMTLMDVLIEPVAIKLGYWTWQSAAVPWQNYLAWWLIALFMQIVLNKHVTNNSHLLSPILILVQVVFFVFIFFL